MGKPFSIALILVLRERNVRCLKKKCASVKSLLEKVKFLVAVWVSFLPNSKTYWLSTICFLIPCGPPGPPALPVSFEA